MEGLSFLGGPTDPCSVSIPVFFLIHFNPEGNRGGTRKGKVLDRAVNRKLIM